MAAQWCDDFTSYGANPAFMLDGLYAETQSAALVDDPDPLVTQQVLRLQGGAVTDGLLRRVLTAAQTVVGIACRVWISFLPQNLAQAVVVGRFNDLANSRQIDIVVTPTGAISAYRGDYNTGTLLGTSAPALTANAWAHVESKVLFSDTVGTVEVRVNGVTVLNLANQDTVATANVSCSIVALANGRDATSAGPDAYFKDFFVWDNTGTRNNNFAGSVSVVSLTPNSDVALTWALSGGATGFSLINESPPVDASFISAGSPPPAIDKMGMTNLPADVTSVRALMTLVRARKTDGGDGNLQVGLISGASVDLGADRPITTAFTYYSDFSEEDPATVAPWLPTAVDAANIQFNRTL